MNVTFQHSPKYANKKEKITSKPKMWTTPKNIDSFHKNMKEVLDKRRQVDGKVNDSENLNTSIVYFITKAYKECCIKTKKQRR